MAEIDVDRVSGELVFDGMILATANRELPSSILERFYLLAEGRHTKDAEELQEELEDAEDTIAELRSQLRRIKEICDA